MGCDMVTSLADGNGPAPAEWESTMLLNVTVKKLGLSFSRDFNQLPAASKGYLAQYGFSQCINDPHAAIKRADYESDEAYRAAVGEVVSKRLEQLDSGNVPGQRVPTDPAVARMRVHVAKAKELGLDAESIIGAAIAKAEKKAA